MSTKTKKQEWTFENNKKWAFIWGLFSFSVIIAIILLLGVIYSWRGYWDESGKTNFIDANEDNYKWSNIPGNYHALFWGVTLLSVALLFIAGSWLKGARWINKKNPFVANQPYIRTKEQNILFRYIVMVAATLCMWSFIMDATFGGFFGNLKRSGDGKDLWKTQFPKIFTEWIFRPQSWYYQCYLTSLFLFIAVIKRKYNWMLVLLPLGFLGSIRTFMDIDDWGDTAYWKSIYFHRFMMIHVLLIIFPVFVIFANRQIFTLFLLKRTFIYTFFMVFFAYIIISTTQIIDSPDDVMPPVKANKGAGEISGAGKLMGKSMEWIEHNFSMYFWLMMLPFGIAIIIGFYLVINLLQYKRWISNLKNDYSEFKKSFYSSYKLLNAFTSTKKMKIDKIKYIPFGE